MRNFKNKELQTLLLANEVTQAKVAKQLGVTRAAVCQWLKQEPIGEKHERMIRDAVDQIVTRRTVYGTEQND